MNNNTEEVILIVDDKPGNILVLENLLASPERTLLKANSGKEALQYSLNKEVDLIILDVQMPGMDGFEVAQILKTNKRTRDIPIIFASAESREHSFVMKGYGEGAVDYLLKPLDPELVKAKVNVLLKIQQQRKELLDKNASLEKSALLIENSADIIGIMDMRSWKIEQVNHAFEEILGFPVAEATGKTMHDFSATPVNLADLFKDENPEQLSFENEMICKDGTHKWLDWKIRLREGKCYLNARDITETKLADERIRELNDELHSNVAQLEATNKELESFSYSVSHDLRAPLRALNGFAKIIHEEYQPVLDDEARRLLGNIRDNALRMGTLIDDLLEFSRLGRKEIQRSPTDMRQLAEAVAEECRQQAKSQASIRIAELPPTTVDHALMKQVWTNLISNAIKYSSKKEMQVVEIGYESTSGENIYYVKDNGAGFDMKYVDKLFGVFQRLHSPKQFEGTGVGLAIVLRIITKHGGRVWADARENEGAVFYFSIPHAITHKKSASDDSIV